MRKSWSECLGAPQDLLKEVRKSLNSSLGAPGAPLSHEACWRALVGLQPNFLRTYVSYQHYRAEGYIVKSGKFRVVFGDPNTSEEMTRAELVRNKGFMASFRHGKKVYRQLVNGQTGHVIGKTPVSVAKVALACAGGLLVALMFWAGMMLQ